MKLQKTILSLIFTIIVSGLLSSCEGDQGPQGPQGPDGNANVKTIQYLIEPTHWIMSEDNPTLWYDEYAISLIDYDIIDYGTVLVYLQDIGGGDYWTALPITNVLTDDQGNIWTEKYEAWYGPEYLYVNWIDTHPTNPLPPNWDCVIKAVIIEGQPGQIEELEGVDLKDYSQVKAALNIE